MFPNHLHGSPDDWMSLYWNAAQPFTKAMENAWLASATAFMPPPMAAMMRAALAWRDGANAGYADPRRPSVAVSHCHPWEWATEAWTRSLSQPWGAPWEHSWDQNWGQARAKAWSREERPASDREASRPPAPVGIAASPAARATATPTESSMMSAFAPSQRHAPNGQTRTGASVVLINTFVVPIAMEEPFLNWWRMLKPAFAAQPGFIAAKLHRSLDQNERYRFINIAEWESTDAYRSALTTMWSSVPKPTIAGLEWHPALYEVVEEA